MNPFEGTRRRQGRKLDSLLLETVRESVLAGNGPVTPSTVAAAVQASGRLLGTAGALEAAESINAELNGLGPLQQLAQDPAVTDIFVNGPTSVWLDRGQGLERSSVHFDTEQQVRSLASRLVSAGGRRLDDGSPCVDVRLNGGYRVHAVLSPISTTGTLLSIRIRRANVFTLPELRESGMFSEQGEWVLRAIMGQRLSFLISGATGSGKTTLLSTLLGLSHPTERLVLIEDAAELNPVHPHVVTLESRHGNLEGGGALDLGELVRQALRMRPDRLIVGECRGAEVRELLTALNTGHTGGGGTIHANAAEAVPARLVALGALAGLNAEAVRLQVSSALDVVIHVDRTPTGRKVASIGVLTDTSEGQKVVSALHWHPTGMTCGPAWPALARRLAPALPAGFDWSGLGGAPGTSAETWSVDGASAPAVLDTQPDALPGAQPDALPGAQPDIQPDAVPDGSWATLNGSPSPWPIP
ncbi:TadA family conjugal transfer-associated ATPase [Paenarthrobacter sp. NPDC091669]|uniref:TadA family conjugal transfer-associated ATPase n=1 Tax=Paenarthrobacter sp. NPDC091669 TaxID=3364384 RepID=UPI00381EC596